MEEDPAPPPLRLAFFPHRAVVVIDCGHDGVVDCCGTNGFAGTAGGRSTNEEASGERSHSTAANSSTTEDILLGERMKEAIELQCGGAGALVVYFLG